ncbi:VanW family protein [Patescibacteria group bacterium]|nr:VanW family protein [Patescibacteria group bacterium]MBU1705270.1 VanW family protein [Patescibacteria group bacterium]
MALPSFLKTLGQKLQIIPSTTRVIFKPLLIILAVIVIVGGSALAAGLTWAKSFEGKIGAQVFVGGVEVSELYPELAQQRIQRRVDELVTDGIKIELEGRTEKLSLSSFGDGDSSEEVVFDVQGAVDRAMAKRHSNDPLLNLWALLFGYLRPAQIEMPVQVLDENIKQNLTRLFPEAEAEVINARFSFAQTWDNWVIEVEEEKPGRKFDTEPLLTELTRRMKNLEGGTITLSMIEVEPAVNVRMANSASETALEVINRAPFTLTYTDERDSEKKWTISQKQTSELLLPSKEPNRPIDFNFEKLDEILEPIAKTIERPAQDARFQMEGSRVQEFAESKPGVSIDRDQVAADLLELMLGDQTTLVIATKETEPEIQTEEVNDLGIKEILGTGISDYSGSPYNRILNIRNGVRLLNGLIIKPGETFSLLNALKPFTTSNGYLPELVIKGDKIEPEIGGGLCQIGTTTFRATMNSGLPVSERRNHSLVVSYYNDPSNGNPGTDATIYDPAPDFKFFNDTGHHVLFQAEMIDEIKELRFTFWGTSDGRTGSYTPPVVLRWIGVGEPVEVETMDLEPGERECQYAHIGADTQFTYTIKRPNGEEEKTVYDSHYRPLPKMCLVGVAELSPETEGPGGFSEFPEGYQPE